jgi:hypothetical protein
MLPRRLLLAWGPTWPRLTGATRHSMSTGAGPLLGTRPAPWPVLTAGAVSVLLASARPLLRARRRILPELAALSCPVRGAWVCPGSGTAGLATGRVPVLRSLAAMPRPGRLACLARRQVRLAPGLAAKIMTWPVR